MEEVHVMEIMTVEKDYAVLHNHFHSIQCLLFKMSYMYIHLTKVLIFIYFLTKCIFSLFLCTAETVY